MIYYESPPGTSLEETDRMLNEVEKSIIKIPEVEAYSRRTGTQMGFFITEPNRGDYLIQLKKNRNKTSNDVIDEIRAKVEATQPALRIDFGQVIGDMLGDLMSSVSPIEVKVFGNNQAELQKTARQVSAIVEKVKGTADVLAGPEINIQPNYVQLAQYGITPNDLQFQMQTALEGNVVGILLENESPIAFVGAGYINTTVGGDWAWFPGSINDVGWSGIENKDFGEITFDLDGGYNTKIVQTSLVAGSTQQTTTTGTFSFALTPDSTNDRIIFNGGLAMLHTNAYYTSLSSGFSFSNVRLIELKENSLRYVMIAADGGVIAVNLVPKPN